MVSPSAERQAGDAHIGVLLPMAGLAAIALPPLELEDVELLALGVADDFDLDLGALHGRRAGLDRGPVGREQDLIENDLVARLLVHQREAKGLSLFSPELLSERTEDRVHGSLYLSKAYAIEPGNLVREPL